MFKWFIGFAAFPFLFGHNGSQHLIECKLPTGHIERITQTECIKKHLPTPTATPRPTATPKPTPTPTRIPTPTPTPKPVSLHIDRVRTHNCSVDSSCYGWTTGVEVFGHHFTADTQVKLSLGSTIYSGSYQGGNDKTRILTDFYALPHCQTFDTTVSGSTGTATASASVSTVCP